MMPERASQTPPRYGETDAVKVESKGGTGRTTLTAHEPVREKENVHESERYTSPRAGVSGPYGQWRRTGRDRQAVQREYGVEIAGDTGVLPWIGQKSGRAAIIDFVNDSRAIIERISFEAHDILAGDYRAVILVR